MATTISLPGETKLALSDLVHELQHENAQLKLLVAELLLRNQQLRNNTSNG